MFAALSDAANHYVLISGTQWPIRSIYDRLPSPLKIDFLFHDEFCMLANPQVITNKVYILWKIYW